MGTAFGAGPILALLILGAAGCVERTASDETAKPTLEAPSPTAFPYLLAEESYQLTSTFSPCDEQTDPRLQTHCKFFQPKAGRATPNGTAVLNVTGTFAGATSPARARLLFSAWIGDDAFAEYKPIPASANLTLPLEPTATQGLERGLEWKFRLDWEGTGQVQARVRVYADH